MKKILAILFFLFVSLFGDEFLEPKDAFKPTFTQNESDVIFTLGLGKGIYIYADKLKFKDGSNELKIDLPKPVKHDEYLIYDANLTINISKSLIKSNELTVEFQGCSSDGLCYQPMSEKFKLTDAVVKNEKSDKLPQNETDAIASTIASGNIWLVLVTFFGFGLLLSLTPCVFPMIPILSSILVKHSGNSQSHSKSFALSVVYVLAMAVAYTIAGVIAGLFGANLQTALQNPVVLVIFSAIFVALALSMFGYFEIALPASFQSKLSQASDKQQGGFLGTAIMGFLSALVVGPCVAPPLAGALVYIGQTGDAFLGGIALFVMSIGMGMPLLALGLGAGKFMPKAGMWMQTITKIFGVIMLGVAIWMLERVLPSSIILILWALLFISSSVYMGTFDSFKEHTRNEAKLIKVLGIIFVVYGAILFASAIGGAKSILNPLEPFLSHSSSKVETNKIMFQRVSTLAELEDAIKNSNKPVMLDFYADWCISCKEYEETTFKDTRVIELSKKFLLLQVDVTKNSEEDKKLLDKFGLFGPPAIIFWDKSKQEITSARLVGYKNPEEFMAHITQNIKD